MIGTGLTQLTAERPSGVCPAFADALSLELAKILQTAVFRRSPILSRLLQYLVEQTLAGRSEQLKGYTVAVDGLARPDSFDAQLDSYPRVQMVRLRKALEAHYALNAPRGQHSLFLCTGSYRVRMAPPDEAYPHLIERKPDSSNAISENAISETGVVPLASFPPIARPGYRLVPWWSVVAVALLVGLSTWLAATIWPSPAEQGGAGAIARMPTLAVEAKRGAVDAATRTANSALIDGLRRSWVARVRDSGSDTFERRTARPHYRLTLSAIANRVDSQLTDTRSATVVWTGSSSYDGTPASLAPLVARIAGPYGAIAQAETARLTPGDQGSYACVLSYFEYVKTREAAVRARMKECLTRPADEARLAAPLDAVRSFATLEARSWPDRAAQIEAAGQFARRAVERDGNDAYAQYAFARIAYLRNNCTTGNLHADRAVLANPNDILVVTALATLAGECAHPPAKAFLEQAFRIRSDSDVALRGFLILAAVSLGEDGRLAELGDAIRPPPGPQLAAYLIGETMIAAAQGRRADATAYWNDFRALHPNAGASDDAHLRTVVLADPIRRRLLKILSDRGVITT